MRNSWRVLGLCGLLLAAPAEAKPVGTFHATCESQPAYASFTWLIDSADFSGAAECARRTGIRYVLGLYGVSRYVPVGEHAMQVRARADAAGLTPHLIAIAYHEEWHEYHPGQGALVAWWVDQQLEAVAQVFPGLAKVWITTAVHEGPGAWYRPVPSRIDAVALMAYTPSGSTWATQPKVVIDHALTQTRLPLVLIAQGFVAPSDDTWSNGPDAEQIAGLAEALKHPQVWGTWIFLWDDLPTVGLYGLGGMSTWRPAIEAALGVQ